MRVVLAEPKCVASGSASGQCVVAAPEVFDRRGVTLFEPAPVPLAHALGEEVGRILSQAHSTASICVPGSP